MKKTYTSIFCFLAMYLLLAACQSNEQKMNEVTSTINEKLNEKATEQELPDSKDNMVFEVETKQYTDPPTEIIVLMRNNSNTPIGYHRQFSIEKNIDGVWYFVPFEQDEKLFQDDAPGVPAQETISEEIDLTELKYNLSPGSYRVTRTFSKFLSINESKTEASYEDFTLTAPFKVTK